MAVPRRSISAQIPRHVAVDGMMELRRQCLMHAIEAVAGKRASSPTSASNSKGVRMRRRRLEVSEDLHWMLADDEEYPFSFARLCESLGLVPEAVRAETLRLMRRRGRRAKNLAGRKKRVH